MRDDTLLNDTLRALEALADKMSERCGDHCSNSCKICEYRNDLRLILVRGGGKYREQFGTVLGQADYNPSCTKLHYVFHPDSKFQVGERVRVIIERLPNQS